MKLNDVAVFWFRRDLRYHDNCAFYHALVSGYKVLPLFIFDEDILNELPKNDHRVTFIYESLKSLHTEFEKLGSSLLVKKGLVEKIWEEVFETFNVKAVYTNHDYEPYAIKRDERIAEMCKQRSIVFHGFKDQVIFEKFEILKNDGKPYTVFTPYKNKWLQKFKESGITNFPSEEFLQNLVKNTFLLPEYFHLGIEKSSFKVPIYTKTVIKNYHQSRDIPSIETSNLSVYLRFGLVSNRKVFQYALNTNETFASELIWREFFMQILFHFPQVVSQNFKEKYNFIPYQNNETDFERWCNGKTGYPIVDAGINQLNKTGFMHNRVRMIVASFLCKHLLIDWRWGEAYFAKKLFDFELSSNNGNWQWVAGTGCDSAPYFRVFNPITQQKKFDPDFKYIKKWNPNYKSVQPIVEHKMARERYLRVVKSSLN